MPRTSLPQLLISQLSWRFDTSLNGVMISKMTLKVSKIDEMEHFDDFQENYNFSTIEAKVRGLDLTGACLA